MFYLKYQSDLTFQSVLSNLEILTFQEKASCTQTVQRCLLGQCNVSPPTPPPLFGMCFGHS